jgi:hypothetical protein
MYEFLNIFFYVFHTILILFVLFGWIWRRIRIAHLVTVALVAGSWFVLGLWRGIGYCPCTDWHWQVRLYLGLPVKSSSYVHFLVTTLTGITIRERVVDVLLVVGLVSSSLLSVVFFLRDRS